MQTLIIVAVLMSFVSPSVASCEQQAKVAVNFMNAYTQYANDVIFKRTSQTTAEWLARSKLPSRRFVASFNALEAEGLKNDPELGWGVDLIVDAQDYPDKGFEFFACKTENYVELQGHDWKTFHVVVKTVRRGGAYVVDGAGRVNIPASQRAKR